MLYTELNKIISTWLSKRSWPLGYCWTVWEEPCEQCGHMSYLIWELIYILKHSYTHVMSPIHVQLMFWRCTLAQKLWRKSLWHWIKKVSEMQAVTSYKTTEWGEPPIYPNSATFSASAEPQWKRSIIHALEKLTVSPDNYGWAENG